jgi:hypothetical protein
MNLYQTITHSSPQDPGLDFSFKIKRCHIRRSSFGNIACFCKYVSLHSIHLSDLSLYKYVLRVYTYVDLSKQQTSSEKEAVDRCEKKIFRLSTPLWGILWRKLDESSGQFELCWYLQAIYKLQDR